MKKEDNIMRKYQYIGREHTLVRIEKKWEKILIKNWGTFESSLPKWNFRTYFKILSSEEIEAEKDWTQEMEEKKDWTQEIEAKKPRGRPKKQ